VLGLAKSRPNIRPRSEATAGLNFAGRVVRIFVERRHDKLWERSNGTKSPMMSERMVELAILAAGAWRLRNLAARNLAEELGVSTEASIMKDGEVR